MRNEVKEKNAYKATFAANSHVAASHGRIDVAGYLIDSGAPSVPRQPLTR